MSITYEELKEEFRGLKNDGDQLGEAVSWFFDITMELHFNRDDDIPWTYSMPDYFETSIVDNPKIIKASSEDLIRLGLLLKRYMMFLKYHGED